VKKSRLNFLAKLVVRAGNDNLMRHVLSKIADSANTFTF
jgi:hypothetical protein